MPDDARNDDDVYQLDGQTVRRLLRALYWYERENPRAVWKGPEMGPPIASSEEEVWLRLTSNLTPNGLATGYLQLWNGSGYADDTTTGEVGVVDFLGHWGLGAAADGEFIRVCQRTIGSAVKYEARSSGAGKHLATLTADLTDSADASANVLIGSATVSVTVHRDFVATGDTIDSGTAVAIFFDLKTQSWIADNVKCG